MSYFRLGETHRALDYFEQGLNICLRMYGESHPEVAHVYNFMGLVYGQKGDLERAHTYHKQALDMMLNAPDHRPEDVALFYGNLAQIYEEDEQFELARDAYQQAIDIRLKISRTNPHLSKSYHGLARTLQQLGRDQEALELHKKGLELDLKILGPNHYAVVESYVNIGKYHRNKRKFQASANNYQQGIAILFPAWSPQSSFDLPEVDMDNVPHPAPLIAILQEKAATLGQWYEDSTSAPRLLEATHNTYRLALDIFTTFRSKIGDPESRKILASVHQDLFESAIETAVMLYELKADSQYINIAFSWTEISKNYLLTEAIRESGAKHFSGIPDSLLDKEQAIRTDLAFYLQKII